MRAFFFVAIALLPLAASAYSGPREKNVWVCQASDSSGRFGMGRDPVRAYAEADALSRCQSRPGNPGGVCMITSCTKM